MYISFIYDHEYVKSDRDFYGDAIISFYPAEFKEKVTARFLFVFNNCQINKFGFKKKFYFKYIFLLGQIIGTIDFMKGFFSAKLNQFKLDNLIILFKS